jgi:peptide/nickel transport system substrate-binding protein
LNLPAPDISPIAGMSDYPGCITHASNNVEDMMSTPIGTGPTRLSKSMPASKLPTFATKAMNGGATPPAKARTSIASNGSITAQTCPRLQPEVASDEIDMIYETISDSVDAIDGLG